MSYPRTHPDADGDRWPGSTAGPGRAGRPGVATRVSRPRRKGMPWWQELPLLLIIAFCLAVLVRSFLLQAFFIPSGSMEDTLVAGDRVLVNKVIYQFREPARGEIVVFEGTDAWAPVSSGDADIGMFARVGRTFGDLVGISRPSEKDYIKRVVGLPGDIVSCCDVDGRVFVNGQPLDEGYVIRDSPLEDGERSGDCRGRRFDEVVVQPRHMFVMGDHRRNSEDSRCQGQVPIDNVIGRAFVVIWPSSRWSSLSVPGTFAQVPAASATAAPGATGAAPGSAAAVPADPAGSAAPLAFVAPILLPGLLLPAHRRRWMASVASLATKPVPPARSRFVGRASGRRLAG